MSEASQIITQEPAVYSRSGRVFTNSEDLARFFRKKHKDVLKAIENAHCSAIFRERNFAPTVNRRQIGSLVRSIPSVEMTKEGFYFIAMGFTGDKAAVFKEAYIARFNAMEDELRQQTIVDPVALLNDPAFLRSKLLEYSGEVIALKAEVEKKDVVIAEAAPKVEFHDTVAKSEREMNLSDVGRHIGKGPNVGIRWMAEKGLIYKRHHRDSWKPFQRYVDRGWFKTRIVTNGDFDFSQTVVTTKGLIGIAALAGKAISRIDLFNATEASGSAVARRH
ncbi:phage regulatory protein/antirepressor Ant [Aureimonas sp. SK2]|uniref:Rha family transcriptional regulator n=1 Tax=Aureimonas sp. SK2 TaxID=3015992 RepID=UPI00244498E7|nr:phage regulatory protein/antirepressor Ant [Aureimonas sp. SK2]